METPESFLGRDAELELIGRRAAEVAARGVPCFVLIEGPPGVGKTALLNRAADQVPDWWRANAYLDAGDLHTPGYGARQLLRKPERFEAPDDPAALKRWVQAAVDAVQEPIVVAMEDLQWLDETSARIIHQVVRDTEDVPMLNLVTTRDTPRPEIRRFMRLADTLGEALHIRLEPWGPTEVGAVLSETVGLPVSTAVTERVHRATDGYPGFVAFLARQVAGLGDDSPANSLHAALRTMDRVSDAAAQLRLSVEEILEATPEHARRMLRALSLNERPLAPQELQRAADADSLDLPALLSSGLAREDPADGRLSIRRAVQRRAVAGTIVGCERSSFLERLVEVVDEAEAVRLRARAVLLGSRAFDADEVVHELDGAAAAAFALGEKRESLRLRRLAFRISRSEEALEALAFAEIRVGDSGAFGEAGEWSSAHGGDGPVRRALLARTALEEHDVSRALALLDHEDEADSTGWEARIVYAHAALEVVRTASQRVDQAQVLPVVERALAALRSEDLSEEPAGPSDRTADSVADPGLAALSAERHAAREELVACLQVWGTLFDWSADGLRRFDEAVESRLRRLRRIPKTEHGRMLLRVARGTRMRLAGCGDRAREDLTTAIALWRGRDARLLAYAHSHLACVLFDAALWNEADEHARHAASHMLDIAGEDFSGLAAALVQMVPRARGEGVPEMRTAPGSAASSGGAAGSQMARTVGGFVEVWTAMAEGDHDRVVSVLTTLQLEPGAWSAAMTLQVLLGRSCALTGRTATLQHVLRAVEEDTMTAGPLRSYGTAHLHGMAALAAGDARGALVRLREALAHLTGSDETHQLAQLGGPFRSYRALLAIDVGTAVAAMMEEDAGDSAGAAAGEGDDDGEQGSTARDEARALLLWAASVFRSCGAETLFRQADELYALVAHGLRREIAPTRRAHVLDLPEGLGADARFALSALTAREREVALLVGRGLSNKDVAADLVLSVRTVEYHVANVLGKLSLASRHDLRHVLSAGS